jgi:hypothetical protein
MIENRYRLEKQIYLGRESIRRTLQMKDRDRNVAKETSSQDVPHDQAVTGTRLPEQTEDNLTQPTNTPLSMDTDTEIAIANHSPIFFKQRSGSSTPRDSGKEPVYQLLRPPPPRRRRAVSVFKIDDENVDTALPQRDATPDPAEPETLLTAPHPTPSSFFGRLRTRSGLALPFTSFRLSNRHAGEQSSEHGLAQPSWSSDTSSDDDITPDWRRHQQLPLLLQFPVDGGGVDPDDQGMAGGSHEERKNRS